MNAPHRDAPMPRAVPDAPSRAPADTIFVRELVLPIAIGVYEEEQGVLQKVAFSVEAELVPHHRAARDDIATVPSYDDIIKAIKAIVAAGHINLTETLAERVASACLAEPRIARVTVRVEKRERGPAGVGVEITRWREGAQPR